jgi:hypothetical protein
MVKSSVSASASAVGKCVKHNYLLIAILIVFFMILYVYLGAWTSFITVQAAPEKFANVVDNSLLNPDKIAFIQGNGIPQETFAEIQYDQSDPSMQSVDGTMSGKTPKSMFMFAYNKCDVKCCGESGGYGCNGGCVCLTNEQKKFMSNRGYNNKTDMEF